MNRLQFLIDPAPDAVQTAADLILMLLTDPPPPFPAIRTRTRPDTGQIEIIAEYGKNRASAPLLHPLKTVKKAKLGVCTPRRKNRRCTISARSRHRSASRERRD